MTGHVFIAASLDDRIARADGNLDWLNRYANVHEDHGYDDFMNSVDGLIMGRRTFETVSAFDTWPYSKPVVVLSKTLAEVPVHAELSSSTPVKLFAELHERGWKRAYLDGGQVIRSFLQEGLVEDLIITRVPTILGDGPTLFGGLLKEVDCKHLGTKTFPSGLVQSKYKVTHFSR